MIDHTASGAPAPIPIGEVLVAQGLLSREQLAAALAEQQQTGRPLGEVLITSGFVSAPHVAQAIATQQGGLAKTEYGFATGFPAAPAADAPAPAVQVAPPPPPVTALEPPQPAPGILDVSVVLPAAPQPTPVAEPAAAVEPVPQSAPAPEAMPPVQPVVLQPAPVAAPAPPAPPEASLPQAAFEPVAPAAPAVAEPAQPEAPQQTVAPEPVAPADPPQVDPELETLRAQVATLQEQLAAAGDVEAERAAAQELREQVASLGQQLAAAGDIQAERAAAEELRAQLAELRGIADSLAAAEARAFSLEDALGHVTADRDHLQQRVAQLDSELQQTAARAQDADDRVTRLEAMAESLRTEIASRPAAPPPAAPSEGLDGRLAVLESRLDQAVDLLGALRGEHQTVSELERQLAAAVADQMAAKQEALLLAERLAARTREYDEATAELELLRAAPVPAAEPVPAAVVEPEGPHLVFASVGGSYALVEANGAVPVPGDVVELDGTRHVVTRVGASPLAGATLACAYTIPAA